MLSLALLPILLGSNLPTSEIQPIPLREVLAVERLGERTRSAIYTDALEAELAAGTWSAPKEGDTIRSTAGEERTWTRYEVGDDGWFQGDAFRGGWAFATVEVPEAGPWRLDASGHALVLVDGEPHAGDHYNLDITRTPLALEAGEHELLFRCGRGRLRATLEPAPAPVYIEDKDPTLADVIRGKDQGVYLALIVANASTEDWVQLGLQAQVEGGPALVGRVATLLPSSYTKLACEVKVPAEATVGVDEVEVQLRLVQADASSTVLHSTSVRLPVKEPGESHVRTFPSAIDGSIQYFAVTPQRVERADHETGDSPALFLSLHGASVEARTQARSYAPRRSGVIVAPTNRRPFGFDWEDWGRLDALEVLDIARKEFQTDPRRTYLTGHSMGGHGTWQIGAHFPDTFAAIAPSAGWRDFWSYTGLEQIDTEDPIGALFARAVNASRTQTLLGNLKSTGIYVLHGDADANVPVTQARLMRDALAEFHPNFAYYERPGAGHWWGNECMDWPPLFRFLEDNVLPDPGEVLEIDFTTVNPAISSECHWLMVESQQRPLLPTRVQARLDRETRTVTLESENLGRFSFDLTGRHDGAEPLLDPSGGPIYLVQGEERQELTQREPDELGWEGRWRVEHVTPPYPRRTPARNGPFKEAFRNSMVFVYGTQGTPEENAWARDKARLDHETWRYRGNGSVEVLADTEYEDDGRMHNVILYGNQDTNAAWSLVLDAPFEVRRDFVRVGEHRIEGDDLALLAVHLRKGTKDSVGVIAGTGVPGCHVTDHLPYFVSGVGYPDWTVLGTEFLSQGLAGVRGAGYFADDWSADQDTGAEQAWR